MTSSYLNYFKENEIPYDILEQYGLSQEMIDDLPQNVMQRLLSGRTTPALPTSITDSEGKSGVCYARINLFRKRDGSVDVNFTPVWEEKELDDFEEEQQRQLMRGDVIVVNTEDRGDCYVQYDESIRQPITVPVSLVSHNIDILAECCGLSDENKKKLQKGEITEITDGDDVITLGIDLNDMACCRICPGDQQAWRQDTQDNHLPKYNFGIYGCWINDQIGHNMDYIPEEQYTPDMINEMKLIGQQRAAFAQMGGLHI